jgi:hypothetical protein
MIVQFLQKNTDLEFMAKKMHNLYGRKNLASPWPYT